MLCARKPLPDQTLPDPELKCSRPGKSFELKHLRRISKNNSYFTARLFFAALAHMISTAAPGRSMTPEWATGAV
jgi:hypothetical protein